MEESDHVTKVVSYDGQTIWMEGRIPLYEVGNFLGGGAAGTVYEAENSKTKEHFALKILNPLGYKLLSPALLRRCAVISKGKPVSEAAEKSKEPLTVEHVWWLHNVSTKQYLAAFYSERQRTLNELSLVQCMNIWGTNPSDASNSSPSGDYANVKGGPGVSRPPTLPPKYADFVRRRGRIFREIRNMRNISSHVNVIRLENVLELAQDSKCTIFLVMELANGGELFDRIKIDCGTREKTAKKFFLQLLSGVRHCHDEGVCHRDLKPENLLLQDFSSAPDGSILKIADFGFSARMAMAENEEGGWEFSPSRSNGILAGSPLRILRSVVGSPFYVAPEVLQAQGYDGRKADAWSIGVILYAMLAGNLPFSQELATCKRFKQFGLWAAEMTAKNPRFWEDPSLQCPPWLFSSKFSPLARSLIVAMLLPDPVVRLSVHECQEHRWCQPDGETESEKRQSVCPSNPRDNPTCQPSALGAALAAPPASSPVMAEVCLEAKSDSPVPIAAPIAQAVIRDALSLPLAPVPSAPPALLDDMTENDFGEDADDDDDREDRDTMDEEQQFVMDDFSDDEDERRQGVAFKKSKKSPGSHLYDPASGLSSGSSGLGEVSQSLFGEGDGRPASGPPCDMTSTGMEYAFRRVSVTEDTKSPVPPRSPYSFSRHRAEGLGDRPVSTGATVSSHRRSFTTPPPIPSNAVPYIVAGTPDLIGEAGIEDLMGMPPNGYSPQDFEHSLNGSRFATDSLGSSMSPIAAHSCLEEQLHMHQQHIHPPSFHDAVKRSTRFITSVPAAEVLEKVESILEQCRVHRTSSPIGLIGRVEVHWESYHLDVWGVHEAGAGNPPLCSLHLYQLPSSTPPISPARDILGDVSLGSSPNMLGSSFGLAPSLPQQLYLVEFVRGQLEIFQFKRFYEWVRQKVSELVKRDYAFKCFDQAGSPIVVSTLADSPRIPGSSMPVSRRAGVSS